MSWINTIVGIVFIIILDQVLSQRRRSRVESKRKYILRISMIVVFTVLCAYAPQSLLEQRTYSKNTTNNLHGMAMLYGYDFEQHFVQTSDDFILPVQRIPQNGPVVFLQHGLLDSSDTWLMLENYSLPFLLWKKGYDVWLGNCRGVGPLQHLHFKAHDPRFWDWSFDEIAKYDFPALVHYALETTGQDSLAYIGHSQGSMIAFAALTTDNSLIDKINLFIALCPAANFFTPDQQFVIPFSGGRILSIPKFKPEIIISVFRSFIAPLSPAFRLWDKARLYFTRPACHIIPNICAYLLCRTAGCDAPSLYHHNIVNVFSNYPSETSTRNLEHFAQCDTSGKLQMFDFGVDKNLQIYGTPNPPQYNISKLTVATGIFYGGNDQLVPPIRVKKLLEVLSPDIVVGVHYYPKYGHADFLWARTVIDTVYPDVIQMLEIHFKTRSE